MKISIAAELVRQIVGLEAEVEAASQTSDRATARAETARRAANGARGEVERAEREVSTYRDALNAFVKAGLQQEVVDRWFQEARGETVKEPV